MIWAQFDCLIDVPRAFPGSLRRIVLIPDLRKGAAKLGSPTAARSTPAEPRCFVEPKY